MAEEQELRIIARLDDQASAGLAALQRSIREMGTGPQAASMEGMRRQAGEVTQGMSGLTQAISGFGLAAAAIPVALAGMAASFAASGITNYAQHITQLGQAARRSGVELAQFRENISTLKTAGIDEAEAVKQLEAFAAFQTELADKTSGAFQRIVAETGPIAGETRAQAKQNMMNFLNEIVYLPQEEALNRVRERSQEVYARVYEYERETARRAGRSEEEQHAYAERMARKAATDWASQFGVPAINEVERVFAKVTQEAVAAGRIQEQLARDFTAATRGIGSAWGRVKESIAAAFVTEEGTAGLRALEQVIKEIGAAFDTPEFKGFAAAMVRGLASAMQAALAVTQQVVAVFRQLNAAIEPLKPILEPIVTVLWNWLNPVAQIMRALNAVKAVAALLSGDFDKAKESAAAMVPPEIPRAIEGLKERARGFRDSLVAGIEDFQQNVPRLAGALEPIKNFLQNPGQALITLFNTATQAAANLIPQSVLDFFSEERATARRQALVSAFQEAAGVAANLIPQSIRDWWNTPSRGFYQIVNDTLDLFEKIWEAFKPVRDFFSDPATAFQEMMNRIKETFLNLVPGPVKKMLGLGDGGVAPEAPAIAQDQLPPAPQTDLVWSGSGFVPRAEAENRDRQPIALPPGEPLAAAANIPSIGDLLQSMQAGGAVAGGQPYLVGEGGPEVMVPGGGGNLLSSGATWGLYGAGLAAELAGLRGGAAVGHAVGRAGITQAGGGIGDVMRGLIPGMGVLEAMHRDAQSGHPLRTQLRGMFGIEDPGEPAPWQAGGTRDVASFAERMGEFGDALDRSMAQQVNVSGVGRISVDVNAPPGTRVNAEGEGLFKETEIVRQTQMLPADSGAYAGTGINAGAGTFGNTGV